MGSANALTLATLSFASSIADFDAHCVVVHLRLGGSIIREKEAMDGFLLSRLLLLSASLQICAWLKEFGALVDSN